MDALAQWLAATSASRSIQATLWLIPLLQAVHILAIAAVLSSGAMLARCVLVRSLPAAIAVAARRFVPWLWGGLVVLAVTGLVLVVGEPKRALLNPAFQLKMLLVALAIAMTLAFARALRRSGADREARPRRVAGGIAVFSLILWCAIAFAGRWIAYSQT